MSKKNWSFRPTELKRAIKTAQSIGLTVSGFVVGTDNIKVIIATEPEASSLESEGAPA